jgi:hypothetical protein
MKKLSIALTFVLIAGFNFTAQAQIQKTAGIRDVDFRNFSYDTSFDEPKTVKMTNGKFEDGGSYDAGFPLYEIFGEPVYGDLNGDRSEDAIVEIKFSAPPSLRSFDVQAYTFQKGAAKFLARINADRVTKDYVKYYPKGIFHYAGVNPPIIRNGQVIVEALMDGSFACPKYTAVFNYKLSGGKFVLSGKPTRKNFTCSE